MAIDILNNTHVAHLYHYDVEPLLYVRLWCCIHRPDDSGSLPPAADESSITRRASAAVEFLNVTEVTKNDLKDRLAKWRKGAFEIIGPVKRSNISVGNTGFEYDGARLQLSPR